MRAVHNFTDVPTDPTDKTRWSGISDRKLGDYPSMVRAYAMVKEACAYANWKTGELDDSKANAIINACEDLIKGKYDESWFPVDMLQGGAGTSTNMNMNEVVANMAILRLTDNDYDKLGEWSIVDPIQDVNRSQSTNDTYPTAARIAMIERLGLLVNETSRLTLQLLVDAEGHADEIKPGRTQLQDAVTMTYGEEISAWGRQISNAKDIIKRVTRSLTENIPLGGTAIGNGINAGEEYSWLSVGHLNYIIERDEDNHKPNYVSIPRFTESSDKIAATSDVSIWTNVSGALRTLALALGKMANDLRLLSSGPDAGINEYSLPRLQVGSSIMPGKVNPVGMEALNQACYKIIGVDATVSAACTGVQLQLFAFEPLVIKEILDGIAILRAAVRIAQTNIRDLKINAEVGKNHAIASMSISAALNETIGYEAATQYVKSAHEHGVSLIDEIEQRPHENDNPLELVRQIRDYGLDSHGEIA